MVKVIFAVLVVSLVFAATLAQDENEFEDQQADFSGARIARSPYNQGNLGGRQQFGNNRRNGNAGYGNAGHGNAGHGNAGYGNPVRTGHGNQYGLLGGNTLHTNGNNRYNGGRPQAYPVQGGYNNNNNRFHG